MKYCKEFCVYIYTHINSYILVYTPCILCQYSIQSIINYSSINLYDLYIYIYIHKHLFVDILIILHMIYTYIYIYR